MLPPSIELLYNNLALYDSVGETISMAFLGTLVGGSLSMILSFLAARNTTPSSYLRLFIRLAFSIERSIPEFAVVLILIAALGAGPFAAMLTLCIATIGFTGKLFADAIEHIDPLPLEGLEAIGAQRSQVIRYGAVPQVLPSFVSSIFYAFDINIRRAIALGIFGGGGIGYELELSTGMLKYDDMLAYIIGIIVLVTVMERISDWLRDWILNKGPYAALNSSSLIFLTYLSYAYHTQERQNRAAHQSI
jgi:phosphonate transport system permease protein